MFETFKILFPQKPLINFHLPLVALLPFGVDSDFPSEKFRRAFEDAVEAFVAWQYFQHPEPKVWLDFDDEEHGEITVSRACGLV